MQRHNLCIMSPSSHFVFDAGGPALLLIFAIPFVAILMPAVVALEGVLLRVMKWHMSWLNCMLYSLAANVVSTIAGCVLVFIVQAFVGGSLPKDRILELVPPMIVAFIASVLIEWAVLAALQPAKKREAFMPALIINIASYILIAVFTAWGMSYLV